MTTAVTETAKMTRIRELNDRFRTTYVGGAVVCTDGIAALSEETRRKIMTAVRGFTAFTPDNDPHGEHDFGSFEVEGEKIFFKIDYYDRDLRMHSPDAADPTVTTRILTIMLAEEY